MKTQYEQIAKKLEEARKHTERALEHTSKAAAMLLINKVKTQQPVK